MSRGSPRNGFSLVELSIVLVILGLLTGGILAGQSLIRAAELRSITAEYQRYVTATQSFRDKYMALPGDMRNATSFWGAADNDATLCKTTQGTGTQTCNGNGNGAINAYEEFRYWQQLANAGLIEGQYSGISVAAATQDATIGVNVPASKFPNSGWSAYSGGIRTGDTIWFDGDYGNLYALGGDTTIWRTEAKTLKPEEAWNIDSKLDDGLPAQGYISVLYWSTCTDAATSGTLTANYRLTSNSVECSLQFRRIF